MNDLEIIRQRLKEQAWEGLRLESYAAPETKIPAFESELIPGDVPGTWCWRDVDYQDDDRAAWAVKDHYWRLFPMLAARGKAWVKDKDFCEKAVGLLAYFAAHNFRSSNWWFNMISVPRNLADLMLMTEEILPEALRPRLLKLIEQGSLSTGISEDVLTGANCLWICSITIRYAVLTNDPALLKQACDRAAAEVRVAPGGAWLKYGNWHVHEGVQADGSFYQHGPRLYSGGYGCAFVFDVSQLIHLLAGTEYRFTDEQVSVLLSHVLDGLRYMSQGRYRDYQCIGRQYTRPGNIDFGFFEKALEKLAEVEDLPRRDELLDFLDSLRTGKKFSGTRFYPVAGFLAHHTGSLYVGAQVIWGKRYDMEQCNSENILGYNLSYGTHTGAMVTGREYYDIAPLWRYDFVPGTTARCESDEELLTYDWVYHTCPAGGGKQEGNKAIAWEKAEHETVSYRTAFFAFPGGFASLNADIRDSEGKALHTTVEQCFAGEAMKNEGGAIVDHGVRYRSLDEHELQSRVETVTGSWYRNGRSWPDTPVTGTLFTAWIDHPEGTGSCAYLLSPADEREPNVRLLQNDEKVQAILLEDGTVMAVFHQHAHLILPDGRVIEKDEGVWLGA